METRVGQYSMNHPQQKAIDNAILSDLVIDCNLSLSIVEKNHITFRHCLSVVDSKYSPVCHRTLTSKLSNTDHVSVTVDIWTDRKMRGFLGVTVHCMEKDGERIQLMSNLLACDHFKGPHTAERICEQFEAKCDEYSIKDKLDYIISDNAANMRKAFSVCFPIEQEDEIHDEDHLDDPELWNDLTLEEQQTVDAAIAKKTALSVFCPHSPADGGRWLERNKVMTPSLSKFSKISSLLHTSTTFKEVFEAEFRERGIPAAVNTRWNSTLRQVKAVIQCDHLKLCHILEKSGHKELLFTVQEWNKLKELVDILKQCGEQKPQVHFLTRTQYGITAPFSDPVCPLFRYLKAAALDPSFPLMWVEHHVLVKEEVKEEVAQIVEAVPLVDEEEREDHCLGQEEGLFAAYCKRQNALLFWAMNRKALPSLSRVAIRVLAVPASTLPVEIVFSHGGLIVHK
uniref:HAT C-terminal dimerisation domain-containing protein n=1 Tax=Oncorhynchus tshawytscha TaxID=74940 RepID=A0A8C8CZU2_ONCTS